MKMKDREPDPVLEIFKQAIYLERQGKAFYSKVAEQAESVEVGSIFSMLAGEEENHIEFLSEHFAQYNKTGKVAEIEIEGPSTAAKEVLTEEIKSSIQAAGYEAAAISAAIEMEKKAIILYGNRAAEGTDEKEKELYSRLASWERTHLDLLTDLDRSIAESVWNENSFWPY
jgi:rubrerythrin